MKLHIALNPGRDDALINALRTIPSGDRAGKIRAALTERFVAQSDIAQAVHRLAAAIERWPGSAAVVSTVHPNEPQKLTSLQERIKDPAEKERIKASLLGGFQP